MCTNIYVYTGTHRYGEENDVVLDACTLGWFEPEGQIFRLQKKKIF